MRGFRPVAGTETSRRRKRRNKNPGISSIIWAERKISNADAIYNSCKSGTALKKKFVS